jgi:ABC-type multidrug transport system fused ATPase/permease subunit
MLRLPDGMRDRIAEVAKANGRSMNAEIVGRLQDSLDGGLDEAKSISADQRETLEKQNSMIEETLEMLKVMQSLVSDMREERKARDA